MLTDEECMQYRRMYGSFNDMVRAIHDDALQQNVWTPMAESLPEEHLEVLILGSWRRNESGMDVGSWYMHPSGKVMWSIAGTSGWISGKLVTHWMPLPSQPIK